MHLIMVMMVINNINRIIVYDDSGVIVDLSVHVRVLPATES